MSLEELSVVDLCATCVREGISAEYRNKFDLVQRLHKHFDESFTATPDKEFFTFLRNKWKEVKTTSGDKSREEVFTECMNTWNREDFGGSLIKMDDSQIKAHAELGEIYKTTNPGQTLMQYYLRGKEAWLDEKDSSSFESGGESNYSDDKSDDKSDEQSDEQSEDKEEEDEEEEEDAGEQKQEDEEKEADEEDVVVDLDVSPAGTWMDASKLNKAEWKKSRVWVAYMEKVLPDMLPKAWTMKRFLRDLSLLKKVRGWDKNHTAKKFAALLDKGSMMEEEGGTVPAPTTKKVLPPPPISPPN